MSEYIKVAVDAMGGDYAPQEPVKGVVEALQEKPELYVYLVGQEDVLKKELDKYTYPKERLEVVHASEIIETGEPPVHAIQKKKDSSLVKALRMVRSKEASAFVSCGSTGAVLVGGQVLVGKSKGVERAPLAPLIPTATGVSLLIDCGANVDAPFFSSGTVCTHGFYLYGICYGSEKPEGRSGQYRCRRRKRECTGEGNLSVVKRVQRH